MLTSPVTTEVPCTLNCLLAGTLPLYVMIAEAGAEAQVVNAGAVHVPVATEAQHNLVNLLEYPCHVQLADLTWVCELCVDLMSTQVMVLLFMRCAAAHANIVPQASWSCTVCTCDVLSPSAM